MMGVIDMTKLAAIVGVIEYFIVKPFWVSQPSHFLFKSKKYKNKEKNKKYFILTSTHCFCFRYSDIYFVCFNFFAASSMTTLAPSRLLLYGPLDR